MLEKYQLKFEPLYTPKAPAPAVGAKPVAQSLWNSRGFTGLEAALVVAAVLIIGAVTWRTVAVRQSAKTSNPSPTANHPSTQSASTADQRAAEQKTADPYAGWLTFKANQENLALRYPADWKVNDTSSGNCAHRIVNGSDCRDRFDITSPDGIIVRYVIHTDNPVDRVSCGQQAPCDPVTVSAVQRFTAGGLRSVELVSIEQDGRSYPLPAYYLHQPLSSGTDPKVGVNKFLNYMIDFTLPSKLGGRYAVFMTVSHEQQAHFEAMSDAQFTSLASVKQAKQILESAQGL